jgi:glycerol-3-phosphate acyltransferase PlsY
MVSLGSIMIALVYPFILNLRGEAGPNILISFIMAGLVIFLHRKNLVRIFNHTEHKFKLGKKDKKEPVTENGEKEQNEENKE